MLKTMTVGNDAGRRRVRIMRQAGESLVLSWIGETDQDDDCRTIEVRVSRICAGGAAILEVLLPENVFAERKETLDGVRALFAPSPA